MKKVIALMSIVGLLTFANFNDVKAQDQPAAEATEQVSEATEPAADEAVAETEAVEETAPAAEETTTRRSGSASMMEATAFARRIICLAIQ